MKRKGYSRSINKLIETVGDVPEKMSVEDVLNHYGTGEKGYSWEDYASYERSYHIQQTYNFNWKKLKNA